PAARAPSSAISPDGAVCVGRVAVGRAALDEANTARLTGVLREFLDRSQSIVVTHAKRTMAAADVLYGITMQESGVSKRVAVKFEDWPDEERTMQKNSEQEVA